MKREAINHTKMRRLARHLGIKIWGARGIMESLWSATRDEAPAGNIGKLSDADIADFVGWDGSPGELVKAMTEAGWLDPSPAYRLLIHDWPDHCEDYIHSRLAIAGLLFANGAIPKTRKLNIEQRKGLPPAPAMPPVCTTSAPIAATSADIVPIVGKMSAPIAARFAEPYLTLPSQTLPSQTDPYPTKGCRGDQNGFQEELFGNTSAGSSQQPVNGRTKSGKRASAEIIRALGPIRHGWFKTLMEVFPCRLDVTRGMDAFERKVTSQEVFDQVLAGARRYAEQHRISPDMKLKYLQGWINDDRYLDRGTSGGAPLSKADQVERLLAYRLERDKQC